MKRFLGLLFLGFAFYSCDREEKPLQVPYEEPRPPIILSINKTELNCEMPFLVRLEPQVINLTGNESYFWVVNGQSYLGNSPLISVDSLGNVDVRLTVNNAVGTVHYETSFTYTSNSMPVVPFFNYALENNNLRAPAVVYFYNYSQRATSVRWDFGDGFQSTLNNPEHTYSQAGTYTVTLTAFCESDTASITANITVLPEPTRISFTRFELLSLPRNYFPETQDDNTHGGDFYLELIRDNRVEGTGDLFRNQSRLPVVWRVPQEWSGEYRPFYSRFSNYKITIWDENNTWDAEVISGVFDGNYIRNNHYPRQLDFVSNNTSFRVFLDYEN